MTRGLPFASASAWLHGRREFAVDDQDLGLAVVEPEGDDRRVEPRVERIEHGARHRHAVMAFEHRRRVGEHDRDRVAAPDAALRQRRGEPARARVELAVGAPQRAVDDRDRVGEDARRALQECQRRQRLDSWRGCGRDRCRRACAAMDISRGLSIEAYALRMPARQSAVRRGPRTPSKTSLMPTTTSST